MWFGRELALHISCGEQAGELTQLELIDNVGCRHRVVVRRLRVLRGVRRIADARRY